MRIVTCGGYGCRLIQKAVGTQCVACGRDLDTTHVRSAHVLVCEAGRAILSAQKAIKAELRKKVPDLARIGRMNKRIGTRVLTIVPTAGVAQR